MQINYVLFITLGACCCRQACSSSRGGGLISIRMRRSRPGEAKQTFAQLGPELWLDLCLPGSMAQHFPAASCCPARPGKTVRSLRPNAVSDPFSRKPWTARLRFLPLSSLLLEPSVFPEPHPEAPSRALEWVLSLLGMELNRVTSHPPYRGGLHPVRTGRRQAAHPSGRQGNRGADLPCLGQPRARDPNFAFCGRNQVLIPRLSCSFLGSSCVLPRLPLLSMSRLLSVCGMKATVSGSTKAPPTGTSLPVPPAQWSPNSCRGQYFV